MGKLVDSIDLPGGLRELDIASLNIVAAELRDELIDVVSNCGGHFASSLGATEITVALHHVFDTPHDRIIWDVGHQAYVHKMVTGRRSQLSSVRKKGGISGFLRRSESPYDCFGAGHAGTSISAAVGMSVALARQDPSRFVVAVIGDGSITAGMAFEALNNAGALGLRNLIVLLNDNEMSISPNVGAISWLFSRALTSKPSTLARSGFKSLYKRGYVPELLYKAIDRAEELTQGFMSTPAMLFESFGFRYIGPVDGHNIQALIQALINAKQQDVPVIIHARTTKGKGYEPAENDPVKWHGVNPFNRSKGEFDAPRSAASAIPAPLYQTVFGESLLSLAKDDPRIVAITAAMASGTGLEKFQKELPQQFFDVGICEQHAVTFAAGLACEGFRPVCAIYSTFLQRAYDQVIHDVCIQNLPVVFAMDRAGVVGNDGETHQGVFDISYLRTIPNMVIMSPKDENELRQMLFTALRHNGPTALRYPRGNGTGALKEEPSKLLEIGKAELLREGDDVLLIGLGPVAHTLSALADSLCARHGITCSVINARFAKPLDEALLTQELPRHKLVCVVEDHSLQGGFSSSILEFANDSQLELQHVIKRFGVKDSFVPHASQAEQHQLNGYDAASVSDFILRQLQHDRKVVNI
ncbi:MAG: 1-deoxy-D-xylulose-5-phosphate synthase [Deltaproteobacteria bacterium]|nr:1-deoxy-D-xylulose-5-phosphate synthase [Deltaproteobacteria bacterium]